MTAASAYAPLGGDLHRHGAGLIHSHPHHGPHTHEPEPPHGHTHGLVDPTIQRSRAGVRAVLLSLLVLGLAALGQVLLFALTHSVALLADLIHNAGDAATALPLGAAFAIRSVRAERWAGLAVVLAIFASACVAGFEAVDRLINPQEVGHLGALAGAGMIGFFGNWLAARIRIGAGNRLNSPALVADGKHAQADAYVSLAVVMSAGALALGLDFLDPLVGLVITGVILRITWQSWRTIEAYGDQVADQHRH
ncbi:MAG TPA: cation diffusion facilitator family transporter [Solirubrobacterales bacterium]